MRKIYRKLIVILFIGMFVLSSCAAVRKHPPLPIGSFVKIETDNTLKFCDKPKEKCISTPEISTSGSGVLISNHKNNSYITTAGHVCAGLPEPPIEIDLNSIALGMFGLNLEFKVHSLEVITKITVVDSEGNRHPDAKTIAYDLVVDLCLLRSSYINKLPAKLSPNKAPIGSTVWNLAAPYAIFYPDSIPIFRGVMAGHRGTGPAAGAMWTDLPARPGSSGSPIFNTKGRLIGILHSTDIRMSEIAYGASREQLRCFLYQGFKMSDGLGAAPALVGCKEN